MESMYFDDFEAGQTFKTGGATLSESQILEFAWQNDPQPFHIDVEAAAGSPYGGIIASGFQTLLVAFRLIYAEKIWNDASLGSLGLDELRWLAPVRPGDTLRVGAEVLETRVSNSKPDRGFVKMLYTTFNQRDEAVMTYLATHILQRRAAAD